jgi:hypothetical protein
MPEVGIHVGETIGGSPMRKWVGAVSNVYRTTLVEVGLQ